MSIRKNTNPRPLELPPEMRDILARNGMRGHIAGSSEGFVLIVQGHDSPLLSYPITEKQLQALTDWGTNSVNRRCYNTFASIVAADFDLPRDFVHARNANGRVAMGLHGYRIGAGEYGRLGRPFPLRHPWGACFLGWTPRHQDGFHLRRIGGNLYYPGAPMVPDRPDGRMKPGELQSGGYGFYYKGHSTGTVAGEDVLKDLETVITPLQVRPRPTEPAKPYHTLITSPVYFSNEKWQECLASHGILIDAERKTLTVQSASVPADMQYDLTDDELAMLTNNSVQEVPVEKRLETINGIIKDDFSAPVTMDTLDSDKVIAIELHPTVKEDLERQLSQAEQLEHGGQGLQGQQGQYVNEGLSVAPEERELPKGTVVMDGNDLAYINPDKGWFREGRHGREVTVDEIRVEQAETEGKYRMTAVIDGETVSHEITQKQYDKFMAIDDYHRLKLFSKIFGEVDMKSRDNVPLGTKIGAALLAGVAVIGELGRGPRPAIYMERHGPPPPPRCYYKPGVDTPMDVAARNFEAAVNTERMQHEMRHGM
ncbi:hypothetical protein [Bacteroides sp. An19]|uniref:hypothetical protein n=1 Tax=Bacteroides sp. An19 TaxID=1965580 RepID=UPI000B39577B|nr:hypothetical protein [Bacteroides sp. An19]OUP30527.1 hypothetical protein B5F25_14465 [Bacteroides sp. An19]